MKISVVKKNTRGSMLTVISPQSATGLTTGITTRWYACDKHEVVEADRKDGRDCDVHFDLCFLLRRIITNTGASYS